MTILVDGLNKAPFDVICNGCGNRNFIRHSVLYYAGGHVEITAPNIGVIELSCNKCGRNQIFTETEEVD